MLDIKNIFIQLICVNINCLNKEITKKKILIKYLRRIPSNNDRKAAIFIGMNKLVSLFLSLLFSRENIERKNYRNGEGDKYIHYP